MSATLDLTGDTLVVEVKGVDRLWALKSRLEIPLTDVVGAAPAVEEARSWLHGLRLGGTHIPGVISAGRFYSEGQWVFWDVHQPDKAVAIQLRGQHFDHLIVEVDDPQAAISRIENAIAVPVAQA